MQNKIKKEDTCKKRNHGPLFIPTGFLIGFGLGFVFNSVPAGMFIGIGIGFLAWIIYEIAISKKN